MALIRADFFSQSLMRTVTITAIVPVDKFVNEKPRERKPYKTLYLLHGVFGNDTDWVTGTRIQRWAQDHDLVVIMPSGENKFYVDNEKSHEYFSRFIGEELVKFTRDLFPLSQKREETFIAGLSMGGYGAIINGLKYYETFGYIAGLSSALMIEDFVNATDGDDIPYINKRSYLESVFGDLENLVGSDKDYKALVEKIDEKSQLHMYMACGVDDALIIKNRDYRDFLLKNHVDLTYEEGSGAHEWDFWDRYIYRVLKWLPIESKSEGISSGHIE